MINANINYFSPYFWSYGKYITKLFLQRLLSLVLSKALFFFKKALIVIIKVCSFQEGELLGHNQHDQNLFLSCTQESFLQVLEDQIGVNHMQVKYHNTFIYFLTLLLLIPGKKTSDFRIYEPLNNNQTTIFLFGLIIYEAKYHNNL